MAEFKQGQNNIEIVVFPDDTQLRAGETQEIRVVMENGQMAEVPWFEYIVDGVVKSKWNAAFCQGIIFKDEKQGGPQ